MKRVWMFVAVLLFSASLTAVYAENQQDKEAIQKTIESYIEAFNAKDSKALASHWAENGDYVNASGAQIKGREAIQKEYEQFFAMAKQPTMEVTITSIYFASDTLVIEDGFREVSVAPNRPASRIRYTLIHVKEDGKWLIQSVRDAVAFEPSNYEHLKGLEWSLGTWVDADESGAVIESNCAWSENRNFIIRTFTTSLGGEVLISGTQWLGWDPVKKEIQSWLFDSTGSIGEGTWTQDGNKWTIQAETKLMSGKVIKETHTITQVDADTIQWESKNRTLDGEALPDTKEVTVKRQK